MKAAALILKEGKNLIRNPTPGGADFVIYADGTPPMTKPHFPETPRFSGSKHLYIGRGAKLMFDAKDTLSGVRETRVSLNDGPFHNSRVFAQDLSHDALFHLSYFSIDHVGNREKQRSLTFEVDTTPPDTELGYEGPHHHSTVSSSTLLKLVSQDNGSGVSKALYSIDKGPEKRYRKPISVAGFKPGKHTLRYYSLDRVRNREVARTQEFYHDKTPPRLKISVDGGEYQHRDVVYVSNRSILKLDVHDDIAGVGKLMFQLDGEKTQTYSKPFSAPQGSGIHWIRTSVADRVGNSREQRHKVYVDGSPPVTDFRIEGAFYWNGDTVIINRDTRIIFIATDLESRVKTLWTCLDENVCLPYHQPLQFANEGKYLLAYYAVDHVDNAEQKKTLSFIVDNSPWAVETVAGQEKHRKRWHFSEETGLIGAAGLDFYLRVSTSPEAGAKSYLLDFSPDDKKRPRLFFRKSGRNLLKLNFPGNRKTFRVKTDGIPPKTIARFSRASRFHGRQTRFYSAGLQLSLKGSEPDTGVQSGLESTYYSIDGSGFIPYREPIRLFFNEKRYQVRYYSVDQVGNIEPVHSLEFEVDLTPPKSTHEVKPPFFGNILSARSEIEIKSADGLSGVKTLFYRFDKTPPKIYRGVLTGTLLQNLPEGIHILHYHAVDQVDNEEPPGSLRFFLDHTPPEAKISILGEQYTDKQGTTFVSGSSRFRISASEKLNEVSEIRFNIDQGDMHAYKNPVILPPVEGLHRIGFDASDRVENRSERKFRKVFLDTTPPQTDHRLIGTQYTYQGTCFINGQTRIRLSSSDTGAGVKGVFYRLNDTEEAEYRAPFTLLQSGPYKLLYYAVDHVINREKPGYTSFYVDSEPPMLGIRARPPAGRGDDRFRISRDSLIFLETEDLHSGVKEVFYSVNGRPRVLYRRAISKLPVGKEIELKVQAEDWVKNRVEQTFRFSVE